MQMIRIIVLLKGREEAVGVKGNMGQGAWAEIGGLWS